MKIDKNILILLGYDYVNALEDLLDSQNIRIVIDQSDLKYMRSESLHKLNSLMGDRLLVSLNYRNDIKNFDNSCMFSCLITLGWRKLLVVDDFKNIPLLINVHPALLPEYKGYHPVPFVILNSEGSHGITAHLINSEMDAGDIVLKKEFPITPFSTLSSLQYSVNQCMPNFLKELLELISAGNISVTKNLDSLTKVRAPKRKPEDSEIFLSDSVDLMFKKVKASDPDRFPAYFVINGEKVFIRLYRDSKASRQTKFDI